jgi:GNAT superfamily N-acetyltransferase
MTSQSPAGSAHARVRVARRQDVPALVDLRVRFLSETARVEPRFALVPDVRERTEHALPVWIDQEDRVLLVAHDTAADGGEGPVVGFATGVLSVWPPVLKEQRVGEVSEVFVHPDRRGAGFGRELLRRLTETLVSRGARVLRAPVPVRNEVLLDRFRSLGYEPLQLVLERNLEEP